MTAMFKAVSLVAISMMLAASSSHVFAKSGGGPSQKSGGGPSQVKTSGTSAAPSGGSSPGSGAGGNASKRSSPCGHRLNCTYSPPGHTQPTCRGGHMGPNGVMIQCD